MRVPCVRAMGQACASRDGRKRLQLKQKYFPWGERAISIFQELGTGWANLCGEGQQDGCISSAVPL